LLKNNFLKTFLLNIFTASLAKFRPTTPGFPYNTVKCLIALLLILFIALLIWLEFAVTIPRRRQDLFI
jgi:hypothetical protein